MICYDVVFFTTCAGSTALRDGTGMHYNQKAKNTGVDDTQLPLLNLFEEKLAIRNQ